MRQSMGVEHEWAPGDPSAGRGARCEVRNAALMMLEEEEKGDGKLKGMGCVEKSRRGQARLN